MVKTQKQSIDFKPFFDYIDKTCASKDDLKGLEGKISYLPTKDEFYEKMDEVLSEVQGLREDFAAHKSMHEDLDKDIPNLQHKVKHLYKVFEIEDPTALAVSI